MERKSKIYIAGHQGMVGKKLHRTLIKKGFENIIVVPSKQVDLRNQEETNKFINNNQPDYIFLLAARVGGIQANLNFPGEYLYDNLMISANVIEAARQNKIKKLIFVGSSCIYPRLSIQPMKEEYLLSGKLEQTNEGYAVGKIAGLKLCEYYKKQYGCNFISAMPPNIYGPEDSFSINNSHVISALIQRFHNGKVENAEEVVLWGTGKARREFLFAKDAADGLIFLMGNYNGESHINMGSGADISIKELSIIIKDIVGFKGEILWDSTKPDGMPQKLLDSYRINDLGWTPQTTLIDGLKITYKWYLENYGKI